MYFNGLFLTKVKIDKKFGRKLTCVSRKNDMRNLKNFRRSNWKPQNWDFDGFFYPKLKMFELKLYMGDMCHVNEEWGKNWRGIDLSVQNRHKELDKFWPEHWKISTICTLMGCLWPKCIMFEIKKCLMALNINAKFEIKLTCDFRTDMGNLKNFHQSTWKSVNWDFDRIILSKVENVWA